MKCGIPGPCQEANGIFIDGKRLGRSGCSAINFKGNNIIHIDDFNMKR